MAATQPGFAIYDVSMDCTNPAVVVLRQHTRREPRAVRGHAGQFSTDGTDVLGRGDSAERSIRSTSRTRRNPEAAREVSPGPRASGAPPGDASPHDVIDRHDDGTRLYIAKLDDEQRTGSRHRRRERRAEHRLPNPQDEAASARTTGPTAAARRSSRRRCASRVGRTCVRRRELRRGWPVARAGNHAVRHGAGSSTSSNDAHVQLGFATCMLEVNDLAQRRANPTRCQTPSRLHHRRADSCTTRTTAPPTIRRTRRWWRAATCRAGVRIFDVRNPYKLPKEVAYYKPPATGNAFRPGSSCGLPLTPRTQIDLSSSNVRFLRKRRSGLSSAPRARATRASTWPS